jgi:hypothetical protein
MIRNDLHILQLRAGTLSDRVMIVTGSWFGSRNRSSKNPAPPATRSAKLIPRLISPWAIAEWQVGHSILKLLLKRPVKLEPADQQFPLIDHLRRQAIVQI